MKLKCGDDAATKHAKKKQWHRLFCLWPRRVGLNDCRWLEHVWRRGKYQFYDGSWAWEYRPIEDFVNND